MSRNRRRRVAMGGSTSLSSQLLGLSLFIMLLAFFIVLNAISQFEQTRVHPVVESLNQAFKASLGPEEVDESPSVAKHDAHSVGEGSTLEKMDALFTAQIPTSQTVVSERKGEMYVRMSFAELEAAVIAIGGDGSASAAGRRASASFLPMLVALMKSNNAGAPYRMDMMLNINENPAKMQNEQPKQLEADIKRMGRIGERLERAGLSPKLVSAGLQKGEEGTVEIHIRRHVPFNPQRGPE